MAIAVTTSKSGPNGDSELAFESRQRAQIGRGDGCGALASAGLISFATCILDF